MLDPIFRSNAELDAMEAEEMASAAARYAPVVTSLARYVRKAFDEAEQHRTENGITARMLKSQRLRAGIYDADKLAAIAQRGGSAIFFNITEPLCEAFTAWAESVFSPAGDRPWDAQPTPIPSLSAETTQAIYQEVLAEFQMRPMATPDEVRRFALDLYDKTLQISYEDATKRCERMVRLMDDQTTEGGLLDAMGEFLEDMGTYPTAILKGPVFVNQKRLARNGTTVSAEYQVIPTWRCVDPFRFYPAPNARSVNDSYICEIVDFDARLLSEMRDAEGWKAEAIDEVLSSAQARGGSPAIGFNGGIYLNGESEKAAMENRVMSRNDGLPDATLRAIEFWGSVPGSMLLEWGMDTASVPDPNKYIEVNCVLIGDTVVRAILNPDPLDRRPYYACSFIRNNNSIWGLKSIPEKMEDCQDAVNGAQRNLLNNAAMASGPMVAYDLDAMPPEQVPTAGKIWPWKCWPFRGTKSRQQGEPIRFFQPDMHTQELMAISDYYKEEAHDRTHIPKYVYGNGDMKGAGATSSGLSQMRTDAQRGIQRVFKNIDRLVMRPAIERLYTWNMVYQKDDALKGDLQIVPRGILALLVREQITMRRQEFLSSTNNPTDMQIIGIEGRAALLREIAKGLDIPGDKVIPSEDELRHRTEAAMQQQQAQQQAQAMMQPSAPPAQSPQEEAQEEQGYPKGGVAA